MTRGETDNLCPCCGSPIPDSDDLRFDANNRTLVRHGVVMRLTPTETKIVGVLVSARRRQVGVSCQEIVDRIYSDHIDGGPDTAESVIRATVSRLRKAMSTLGLTVQGGLGRSGAGYRLVVLSDRPLSIVRTRPVKQELLPYSNRASQ